MLDQIVGTSVAIAAVGGFFGAVGYWIKGSAERQGAQTAAKSQESGNEKSLRAELHELSRQLHKMANEVMVVKAQVLIAESDGRNLTFILQLVMDELGSINPDNKILSRARDLLLRAAAPDPVDRAAKLASLIKLDRQRRRDEDQQGDTDTMKSAKDSEAAAYDTVAQVREDERNA